MQFHFLAEQFCPPALDFAYLGGSLSSVYLLRKNKIHHETETCMHRYLSHLGQTDHSRGIVFHPQGLTPHQTSHLWTAFCTRPFCLSQARRRFLIRFSPFSRHTVACISTATCFL